MQPLDDIKPLDKIHKIYAIIAEENGVGTICGYGDEFQMQCASSQKGKIDIIYAHLVTTFPVKKIRVVEFFREA